MSDTEQDNAKVPDAAATHNLGIFTPIPSGVDADTSTATDGQSHANNDTATINTPHADVHTAPVNQPPNFTHHPQSTVNHHYSPIRSPLLTSVHNPPILKGISGFTNFKRLAEGLMVSHERYYMVQDVNVPHTSTSVRRTVPRLHSLPTVHHPYQEEDRKDVWGFLSRCLDESITSNFSIEVLDPVVADAAGLWKEIHERFDRADIQSAGQFYGKLWSKKMKENGDAQKHINRFQNYHNKLTIAGKPPSDKNYATALLRSLPDQYAHLRYSKFSDPFLTSHSVKSSILAEWGRLGYPGRDKTDDSSDDEYEAPKKDDAKAFVSKPESKNKEREVRKRYCSEHPNATTHDTKDCFALKKQDAKKKDQELEDLSKQIAELKAASAKVAVAEVPFPEVGLGEEPGNGSTCWVAVSPTALIAKSNVGTAYVIDSGATEHMVCTDKDLHDKVPFSHAIRTAGNHLVQVTHKGTLRVGNLVLKDVLYAPALGFNLLSVHKLGQLGYAVNFQDDRCSITTKEGDPVLDVRGDGLYSIKASDTGLVAQTSSANALFYLHRSLAHLNWLDVVKLAKSGRLGSKWKKLEMVKDINILCEPCTIGKAHRQRSPPSKIRGSEANAIAHVDIFGPTRTLSYGGHCYILACYDDHTHSIQLYFLRSKKEATSAFKQYLNLVKNQCGSTVKLVRSDNGGEFTAQVFLDMLAAEGIVAQRIPPAAHCNSLNYSPTDKYHHCSWSQHPLPSFPSSISTPSRHLL